MELSAPQESSIKGEQSSVLLVTGAIATLPGLGYWLAFLVLRFYERPDFVPVIWPILRPLLSASLVLCPLAIFIAFFASVRGLVCRRKNAGISVALWFLAAVLFTSMLLHFFLEAGAGV